MTAGGHGEHVELVRRRHDGREALVDAWGRGRCGEVVGVPGTAVGAVVDHRRDLRRLVEAEHHELVGRGDDARQGTGERAHAGTGGTDRKGPRAGRDRGGDRLDDR